MENLRFLIKQYLTFVRLSIIFKHTTHKWFKIENTKLIMHIFQRTNDASQEKEKISIKYNLIE